MSHCVVPQWNRRHQKQQEDHQEGTNNMSTSPHVHTQNLNNLLPMSSSKYEVAEQTWENGQVAMHGLGKILPNSQTKSTWPTLINNDTLESIVHQATIIPQSPNPNLHSLAQPLVSPSEWPGVELSAPALAAHDIAKKRMRESVSEPVLMTRRQPVLSKSVDVNTTSIQDDCGSASATFCWANDTTRVNGRMVSLDESSRSVNTMTTTFDEDSTSHGGSENRDKHETKGSISARRSRATVVHNESERRRRNRINQKMKTLQKLVPNASKTDKASILDEVIEYLKQLQTQIQLMSTRNNINMTPHMNNMMMPSLGLQHQLNQMALVSRMVAGGIPPAASGFGMGIGMGMIDMANLSRNSAAAAIVTPTPPFVPPPFILPPATIPKTAGGAMAATTTTATNSVPFSDPYSAFLAQSSMNMDFYNKMASLYRQQANQQTTSNKLHSNLIHSQNQ